MILVRHRRHSLLRIEVEWRLVVALKIIHVVNRFGKRPVYTSEMGLVGEIHWKSGKESEGRSRDKNEGMVDQERGKYMEEETALYLSGWKRWGALGRRSGRNTLVCVAQVCFGRVYLTSVGPCFRR
jgi:hypothetical protein